MTGQKTSSEVQRFPLQPAPRWRLLNVALHGLVASLLLAALPQQSGSLALAIVAILLLLASAWNIDGQFALRGRHVIRYLQHDADGWAIGADEAVLQTVRLRAGSFISAGMVVLSWQRIAELAEPNNVSLAPPLLMRAIRRGSSRTGYLLLVPAMLGQDDYRRLCRQLWQYQTSDE